MDQNWIVPGCNDGCNLWRTFFFWNPCVSGFSMSDGEICFVCICPGDTSQSQQVHTPIYNWFFWFLGVQFWIACRRFWLASWFVWSKLPKFVIEFSHKTTYRPSNLKVGPPDYTYCRIGFYFHHGLRQANTFWHLWILHIFHPNCIYRTGIAERRQPREQRPAAWSRADMNAFL